MKWIKRGLIYGPDGEQPWARHSALQPTPLVTNEGTIRIFAGFRDDKGVSRVGYVDVDQGNPSKVLKISERPVLDIGVDGAFDENGVVPCAIAKRDGQLFLYYAGYQLGQKVKFFAFAGLAISDDKGESFIRYQRTPVLDRNNDEMFFRAIHSIMYDEEKWKIWYGGGSEFTPGEKKQLPVYDVKYLESRDGIHFEGTGLICIPVKGGDEHRVGRPYVIKDGRMFRMFYSVGTKSRGFRLGYAESPDGVTWTRKDEEIGIDVSEEGWDSKMVAYPSVVRCRENTYLFYNGNNYGEKGVGYAVLEHW